MLLLLLLRWLVSLVASHIRESEEVFDQEEMMVIIFFESLETVVGFRSKDL